MNTTLTAVKGLKVGHWTQHGAKTGCTVILCPPNGCIASGMALGGAPGTRELALLAPEKTVERAHAVVLSGGSAYGLDAASGVMRWLDEMDRGFATPFGKVPIVPAAVIYDLGRGDPSVRPDAGAGYTAASLASSEPVTQGAIGVGTGAAVGKYLGFEHLSASGLGSAAQRVGDATVAALAVSNAAGDVVDPQTGQVVAGAKKDGAGPYTNLSDFFPAAGSNTTLVVVATDACISKTQAYGLAQSAHIGIAQVTRPSHTMHDGDVTFVLSTCAGPEVPLITLSVMVQEVVARAIITGVRAAQSV